MGVRKFVVHGGRRWHELDLSSGRVEGWGAVSFVRMRRGQLGVQPRARVLRALRALSEGGKRSAAQDGPRLSQIRHLAHERPSKYRRQQNVEKYRKDTTHSCCQHNSHCRRDANFNSILKPQTSSVAVQCSGNVTTGVQAGRIGSDEITIELHTNKSKTIDDENEILRNKNHASERSKAKDHGSEKSKNKDPGSERLRSKTLLGRKNATQDSISSDIRAVEHDAERKNMSQRKTGPQSEPKQGIDKEKRRNQSPLSLSSYSEFEMRRKDELQRKKALRTKPVKAIDTKKRSDQTTLMSKNVLQRKKSDKEKRGNQTYESDKEKRGNQTYKSSSSDSEFEIRRKNKLQRKKDDGVEAQEPEEQLCKELVVTEEDVALLRRFLLRDEADVFGVQLELFDTDDKYKERFFYSLNPLVNLERCPRIARLLRARDRADCASLKRDFVTTLGLRSVADAGAARNRYRMRARRSSEGPRARRNAASHVGKENIATGARRNAQADGVLEEKKTNERRNNTSSRPKPAAKPAPAPGERAPGDRGGEGGPGEGTRHAANTQAAKRSSGAAREYSAEEDAYIVRWVRGDGRAHRVNGNRLWAQLQPFHRANTGRARSWQSLRNRYLRHLLPTLGARALPPHEAARLRAAAAHGELKARKPPPRRNSAFEPPRLRSAWGQRPRPPPDRDAEEAPAPRATAPTTPTPPPAPRATAPTTPTAGARTPPPAPRRARDMLTSTPTYSALTKRFARAHRAAPDSDASSVSSAASTARRTASTRRSNKRARSRSGSRARPHKRRRSSPQRDKTAQRAKDSPGETTAPDVKRSNKRSKSSDSDTVSPKPNKRPTSVGQSGSRDRAIALAGATESNVRRRTRSQGSDSEWTDSDKDKTSRRSKLSYLGSSSTSSLSSVTVAPPSIRSRLSATSANKRPATRSERTADKSERRLDTSRNDDTNARDDTNNRNDRRRDNTNKHNDPRNGDQNGLLRSDAKSRDQRNRLRERNAQDSDETRHRDRSARRDNSEVQRDEKPRPDHSERQKPRKRRLYNPKAT